MTLIWVVFEQLDGYKDSNDFLSKTQEILISPHISFEMNPLETQNVLETIIPADSIDINTEYGSHTYINADITLRQAAQLMGVMGLENLKNIEHVLISFDRNDDIKYIQIKLSDLDKSSSVYSESKNDSKIHEYIRELVYTITDYENTDISFSGNQGLFEFAGCEYTITITLQDELVKQSIDIQNSDYKSPSPSSSKGPSDSSSSYTCQASSCSKAGTHSITGLNGTTEYYCDEHYSQLGEMMDMIMED